MPVRRTMVVELAGELQAPHGLSRARKLAWMKEAEIRRKRALLERIEHLRALDPALEIEGGESLFPVLVLTATDEVFVHLEQDPAVARITPGEKAHLP
jgi:hypothetical protein